jgi:hypothetical protein
VVGELVEPRADDAARGASRSLSTRSRMVIAAVPALAAAAEGVARAVASSR